MVVAFARAAREALVETGIDNAKMELLDRCSDPDNWTALKRRAVPDEDATCTQKVWAAGIQSCSFRAAAGQHDRVMQVLSRFNLIDIDNHAAQWRKFGAPSTSRHQRPIRRATRPRR